MNKYIKVEKYDENGDMELVYLEPFNVEAIAVAIETELLEDGEDGESILLTIVEMEKEEFEEFNANNGY